MAPPPYSTINGDRYDPSACDFRLNGKQYLFADFGDSLEREPGVTEPANSPQDAGTSTGTIKGTFSFSLYQKEAMEYEADLGDGFMEVQHPGVLTYQKGDGPERKRELFGIELTGREEAAERGKPVMVKYKARYSMIKIDGRFPIKDARI